MQSRHVPPPQSDAGEDVSGRIEAARAPMPPGPAAPPPINPVTTTLPPLASTPVANASEPSEPAKSHAP